MIDYLSLDTEGSELAILEGVDFDRLAFRCISVEHNYVTPRRAAIERCLTSRGYAKVRAVAWDDFYRLKREP